MIDQRSGYVRSVLGAITWKSVGVSLSLGFAVSAVRWVQNASHAPANFVYSTLLIVTLGSLLVMVATFAADQAVRRGAPMLVSYCAALACASLLTAWGQFHLRALLHLYTAVSQPGVPERVQHTQMTFVFCDVLMFGGLAMFAYVNKTIARKTLEDVRLAELKRVQLERTLTQSGLAAARALVDPDVLFEDLGRIRHLYLAAAASAEAELEALIERLHGAVRSAARSGGADTRE